MFKIGIGYDVHPLTVGRKLVLGGVQIPYPKGLHGHSDADVLIHAICDAILGAIGKGDIGKIFPNTDPQWKDHNSLFFLEQIGSLVSSYGAKICNIDATIIAQNPKLAPFMEQMRHNIASASGINPEDVNIKATTNEGLGFIGREEGIAAIAVVLIQLR